MVPNDIQKLLREIKSDVDFVQVERRIEKTLHFLRVAPSARSLSRDQAACLLAISMFADDADRADLTDEQVARSVPIARALLTKNGFKFSRAKRAIMSTWLRLAGFVFQPQISQ